MNYRVVEIFDSWQGEGFHTGRPTTFIRLAGCNLNCRWCDTDFLKFQELTLDEIVSRVTRNFVVLTGGEPTEQNVQPLIAKLKQRSCYVAVETNGINQLPQCDWLTISPKSGHQNRIYLARADELKVVVSEDNIEALIQDIKDYASCGQHVWLQPEGNKPENLKRCMELSLETGFRVGHQMHVIRGWK